MLLNGENVSSARNLAKYESNENSEKSSHPIISVKSAVREDVESTAIGLDLYEQAQELSEEEIESEYSKIRRKIDKRLLPILCITYTLQFLDKLSLNYASAYSLKEDLGLTGQRYSWVAAIFNFGYLFWALPSNYIIQRAPVAKYTGVMLF
ncbi:uncharacterized protein AC631_05366, partial [Debaryomyces fabryi]